VMRLSCRGHIHHWWNRWLVQDARTSSDHLAANRRVTKSFAKAAADPYFKPSIQQRNRLDSRSTANNNKRMKSTGQDASVEYVNATLYPSRPRTGIICPCWWRLYKSWFWATWRLSVSQPAVGTTDLTTLLSLTGIAVEALMHEAEP
jgi:hypothetical protein